MRSDEIGHYDTIKIHPELKKHNPPISKKEFKKLEQSILSEGIKEKITVWPVFHIVKKYYCKYCYTDNIIPEQGDCIWVCPKCNYGVLPFYYDYFIVDGHQRFKIAKKYNLNFEIDFADFDEFDTILKDVKDWMDEQRESKTNLTKGISK